MKKIFIVVSCAFSILLTLLAQASSTTQVNAVVQGMNAKSLYNNSYSYPIFANPDVKSHNNFVTIKAGTFNMGSPSSEPGHTYGEDLHSVTLAQDFEIQRTEVTQVQWFLVMGTNPSHFEWKEDCPNDYIKINEVSLCRNNPVETVTWFDAQEFIKKLNGAGDGYIYRLPTEAEWEYAARAGTQTRYWWGEDIGQNNANCNGCGSQWDGKQTAPVGSFKPSAFGLYDTAGNVQEWVEDCWRSNYWGAQDDGSARLEMDGGMCDSRLSRGGSWFSDPQNLRSAFRGWNATVSASRDQGFRIARDF